MADTDTPAINDNLTRAEAMARTTRVSGVAYAVSLDLTTGSEHFISDTTATFSANLVGLDTFIDLEAMEIIEATINDRPILGWAYDQERCRIALRGLVANNTVRIVARCRYQHTGVGLHRFVDPTDDSVYLHTQFEPFDAHRVFACFDQPDLKGPFSLTVTAPSDWTVISNSPAVSNSPELAGSPVPVVTEAVVAGSDDGAPAAAIWAFAPTPEIPTYLAALVAGPYCVVRDRHRDLELAIYCRRSLVEYLDADEIFAITKAGLEFFEAEFAIDYAFDKYDQLFVPEFNFGAMENPGCVTFNEHMVFRSRQTDSAHENRADVILHEMAHMWFGDLVTMRWWDDLWLNESFATYMASAALARATRFTDSWVRFAAGTKAGAAMADQLPSTHPISADIVDTDAVRLHFDGITYNKGASVLKQLVAWVGHDAFTEGVRAYFLRHGWANAELSDFLAALERTSGRDLGPWAAEWLQTTGVNTLRPIIVRSDDETYESVTIAQEAGGSAGGGAGGGTAAGAGTLRSHRVAVGIYDDVDGRLTRRTRVEVDVVGGRTVVEALAGEAAGALVLVNDDDLTYAKLRLDPDSLAVAEAAISRIDDPLARNLAWAATWDMVRDGELSARRWLEMLATHAALEKDQSALARLLGQGSAAVDFYVHPPGILRARQALATAAGRQLRGAEASSDIQLVWARHLLAVGEGDDHHAWCRGLLDGTDVPDGLSIDTDLRWSAVGALAAGGAVDAVDRVQSEMERDPTDIGRRRGAAAMASQPLAEAKAAAWERLLTPGMHLAELRAVAGSFWRCGQDEVLRGYVAAYFEAVPSLWADRTRDEALSLLVGLFPSSMVDTSVVTKTEAALADDSLAGPVRRVLMEGADRLSRALRARDADADADADN